MLESGMNDFAELLKQELRALLSGVNNADLIIKSLNTTTWVHDDNYELIKCEMDSNTGLGFGFYFNRDLKVIEISMQAGDKEIALTKKLVNI